VPRRLRPVPPACPLLRLAPHLRPGDPLGVWLEPAGGTRRLRLAAAGARGPVLLSPDLGVLLGAAGRVVVSDGRGLRVLSLPRPAGARAGLAREGAARGPPRPVDWPARPPLG